MTGMTDGLAAITRARRRRLRQEVLVRATIALLVLVFNESYHGASLIRVASLTALALNVPYYVAVRIGWQIRLQAYVRLVLDILLITLGLYGAGGILAAPYLSVYMVAPIYVAFVLSGRRLSLRRRTRDGELPRCRVPATHVFVGIDRDPGRRVADRDLQSRPAQRRRRADRALGRRLSTESASARGKRRVLSLRGKGRDRRDSGHGRRGVRRRLEPRRRGDVRLSKHRNAAHPAGPLGPHPRPVPRARRPCSPGTADDGRQADRADRGEDRRRSISRGALGRTVDHETRNVLHMHRPRRHKSPEDRGAGARERRSAPGGRAELSDRGVGASLRRRVDDLESGGRTHVRLDRGRGTGELSTVRSGRPAVRIPLDLRAGAGRGGAFERGSPPSKERWNGHRRQPLHGALEECRGHGDGHRDVGARHQRAQGARAAGSSWRSVASRSSAGVS